MNYRIINKLKEFLKIKVDKNFIIIATILLSLLLGFSSFIIANDKTNREYRQKQATCEHDWKVIFEYNGGGFEIYCPKCQLQDYVSTKDWNRIQIDMEYNKIK